MAAHFMTIAKILSQIRNSNPPVPIEIFAQAKAKDAPTDAMPKFLEAYTSHSRIGTLMKEAHAGKLVDEWNKLVSEAEKKPELVDMAPAISSVMAPKDEDELVSVLFQHSIAYPDVPDRRPSGQLLTLHLLY